MCMNFLCDFFSLTFWFWDVTTLKRRAEQSRVLYGTIHPLCADGHWLICSWDRSRAASLPRCHPGKGLACTPSLSAWRGRVQVSRGTVNVHLARGGQNVLSLVFTDVSCYWARRRPQGAERAYLCSFEFRQLQRLPRAIVTASPSKKRLSKCFVGFSAGLFAIHLRTWENSVWTPTRTVLLLVGVPRLLPALPFTSFEASFGKKNS